MNSAATCYNSLSTFGWLGESLSEKGGSVESLRAALTASLTTADSSLTLVCGPQAPTTLPRWSIRYFQKFHSGEYPVFSECNNTTANNANNCTHHRLKYTDDSVYTVNTIFRHNIHKTP